MSISLPSPFDSFPLDGTKDQFFDCVILACNRLAPYLNEQDVIHQGFMAKSLWYGKTFCNRPDDGRDREEIDWDALVMAQRQIVTMFHMARDKIIASQAIAQVKSQSESQSRRASVPRKLPEEAAKRAAREYHALKAGASSFESVKALARHYGVTETTIRTAAKRHPVN